MAILAASLAALGLVNPPWQREVPKLTEEVTIRRDECGVPHIYGPTDEAVAFGLGYCQAEDNLRRLAENVAMATGRWAEVAGEEGLESDKLVRLLRVVETAKGRYEEIPAKFGKVIEAFCQGVNFYIERHPESAPEWFRKLEPWQVVALSKFVLDAVFLVPWGAIRERAEGWASGGGGPSSNMWALAPERTEENCSMLYVNPHLGWEGLVQWFEAHLKSDEGWNVIGGTFFGSPVIFLGHNGRLGWSHTVNHPAVWDVYELELDPENPCRYRYGGGWRELEVEEAEIPVRTDGGTKVVKVELLRSHYGPIVWSDGRRRAYAVRFVDSGVLPLYQWYLMNKARNLGEFLQALSLQAVPMFNVVYADVEGNILYVYNCKVYRRKVERYDWTRPLPGWDPDFEWKDEFIPLDELPRVLNPKAGFVQNCNSCPWETTEGDDNPAPSNFPPYLVREGMTIRAQMARRFLGSGRRFSWREFAGLPWDTHVLMAERLLPDLEGVLKRSEEVRADPELREAARALLSWNMRADTDSVGMTLFHCWFQAYRRLARRPFAEVDETGRSLDLPKGVGDPEAAERAFVEAVRWLVKYHGTWKVKWGEVHRLRWGEREFPLPGGPGEYGISFCIGSHEEGGKFYAHGGHSYMMVVKFSKPRVEALSVHPLGNVPDPEARGYKPLPPLFASGRFKPAWFYDGEVEAHTVRAYKPGEGA